MFPFISAFLYRMKTKKNRWWNEINSSLFCLDSVNANGKCDHMLWSVKMFICWDRHLCAWFNITKFVIFSFNSIAAFHFWAHQMQYSLLNESYYHWFVHMKNRCDNDYYYYYFRLIVWCATGNREQNSFMKK